MRCFGPRRTARPIVRLRRRTPHMLSLSKYERAAAGQPRFYRNAGITSSPNRRIDASTIVAGIRPMWNFAAKWS